MSEIICHYCKAPTAQAVDAGKWMIECTSCGALGPDADTEDEAIATWRAINSRLALADELAEALRELEADRAFIESIYVERDGSIHPAYERKYKRDIEPYDRAKNVLARWESLKENE
jgi:hypothetical protein